MKTLFAAIIFSLAVITGAYTLNATCTDSNKNTNCPVSAVIAAGHPEVMAGLVNVSVEIPAAPEVSDWQNQVENTLVVVQETRDQLVADWKSFLLACLATRYLWIWAFLILALLVRP